VTSDYILTTTPGISNLVVDAAHHCLQGRIMMKSSASCDCHDWIMMRLWAVDGPWVMVVSRAASRQRGVLPVASICDGIVVRS
jgi:hypothetical protein